MREKSPRKLWQIHCSTAFTIMLMSAFVLGCNFTQTRKLYVWPEGTYSTFGWPLDACLLRFDQIIQWNYKNMLWDAAAGLAFIALAGAFCEWYTRFQRTERATPVRRRPPVVLKPASPRGDVTAPAKQAPAARAR